MTTRRDSVAAKLQAPRDPPVFTARRDRKSQCMARTKRCRFYFNQHLVSGATTGGDAAVPHPEPEGSEQLAAAH